jgi:carbamoyl-phosphate synthase small subunit
MDLAKDVTALQTYGWDQGLWKLGEGLQGRWTSLDTEGDGSSITPFVSSEVETPRTGKSHVVAIDYGIKHNILRNLVDVGCDVTVVTATATFDEIMAHAPDGLFLSNGPGDPARPANMPCRSSAMAGRKSRCSASASATRCSASRRREDRKDASGPSRREPSGQAPVSDGAVEITSMNHGFAVDADTLPANAKATHTSLFDGSAIAALNSSISPRSACNITPRPLRDRRTAIICSRNLRG